MTTRGIAIHATRRAYVPKPGSFAERALALLAAERRPMFTTDLAQRLGACANHVHKLLDAAVDAGYVLRAIHNREGGGHRCEYRLGPVSVPTPAPLAPRGAQGRLWRRAPAVGDPRPAVADTHGMPVRPVLAHGIAAGFDERYQVNPATFEGGEFMAEWRRLRGQAQ